VDTIDSPLRDLAAAVNEQNANWRARGSFPTLPARFRSRARAAAIDVLVVGVLSFFLVVVMIASTGEDYDGPPWLEARGAWVFDLAILSLAALYLSTDALFGATFGKMLSGTRIAPPLHRRMFLRWSLKILPLVLCAIIALVGLWFNSQESWRTFQPTFFNSVLPDWLILATLPIMVIAAFIPWGGQGQPWYDYVAGTIVISGRASRPPVRGFEPIFPSESRDSVTPASAVRSPTGNPAGEHHDAIEPSA
jgi:hypothetical protein